VSKLLLDNLIKDTVEHRGRMRKHPLSRLSESSIRLQQSWWIWVLVKHPALVLHYLEAGVSQLTGENKIDYREYLYSGAM
jgi:hypothetical protein